MRKYIIILMFCLFPAHQVFASENFTGPTYLNNHSVEFQTPIIEMEDIYYYPLIQTMEKFSYSVTQQQDRIKFEKEGRIVFFYLDTLSWSLNGEPMQLIQPPIEHQSLWYLSSYDIKEAGLVSIIEDYSGIYFYSLDSEQTYEKSLLDTQWLLDFPEILNPIPYMAVTLEDFYITDYPAYSYQNKLDINCNLNTDGIARYIADMEALGFQCYQIQRSYSQQALLHNQQSAIKLSWNEDTLTITVSEDVLTEVDSFYAQQTSGEYLRNTATLEYFPSIPHFLNYLDHQEYTVYDAKIETEKYISYSISEFPGLAETLQSFIEMCTGMGLNIYTSDDYHYNLLYFIYNDQEMMRINYYEDSLTILITPFDLSEIQSVMDQDEYARNFSASPSIPQYPDVLNFEYFAAGAGEDVYTYQYAWPEDESSVKYAFRSKNETDLLPLVRQYIAAMEETGFTYLYSSRNDSHLLHNGTVLVEIKQNTNGYIFTTTLITESEIQQWLQAEAYQNVLEQEEFLKEYPAVVNPVYFFLEPAKEYTYHHDTGGYASSLKFMVNIANSSIIENYIARLQSSGFEYMEGRLYNPHYRDYGYILYDNSIMIEIAQDYRGWWYIGINPIEAGFIDSVKERYEKKLYYLSEPRMPGYETAINPLYFIGNTMGYIWMPDGGYNEENALTITVRDFTKVEAYINALKNEGFTHIKSLASESDVLYNNTDVVYISTDDFSRWTFDFYKYHAADIPGIYAENDYIQKLLTTDYYEDYPEIPNILTFIGLESVSLADAPDGMGFNANKLWNYEGDLEEQIQLYLQKMEGEGYTLKAGLMENEWVLFNETYMIKIYLDYSYLSYNVSGVNQGYLATLEKAEEENKYIQALAENPYYDDFPDVPSFPYWAGETDITLGRKPSATSAQLEFYLYTEADPAILAAEYRQLLLDQGFLELTVKDEYFLYNDTSQIEFSTRDTYNGIIITVNPSDINWIEASITHENEKLEMLQNTFLKDYPTVLSLPNFIGNAGLTFWLGNWEGSAQPSIKIAITEKENLISHLERYATAMVEKGFTYINNGSRGKFVLYSEEVLITVDYRGSLGMVVEGYSEYKLNDWLETLQQEAAFFQEPFHKEFSSAPNLISHIGEDCLYFGLSQWPSKNTLTYQLANEDIAKQLRSYKQTLVAAGFKPVEDIYSYEDVYYNDETIISIRKYEDMYVNQPYDNFYTVTLEPYAGSELYKELVQAGLAQPLPVQKYLTEFPEVLHFTNFFGDTFEYASIEEYFNADFPEASYLNHFIWLYRDEGEDFFDPAPYINALQLEGYEFHPNSLEPDIYYLTNQKYGIKLKVSRSDESCYFIHFYVEDIKRGALKDALTKMDYQHSIYQEANLPEFPFIRNPYGFFQEADRPINLQLKTIPPYNGKLAFTLSLAEISPQQMESYIAASVNDGFNHYQQNSVEHVLFKEDTVCIIKAEPYDNLWFFEIYKADPYTIGELTYAQALLAEETIPLMENVPNPIFVNSTWGILETIYCHPPESGQLCISFAWYDYEKVQSQQYTDALLAAGFLPLESQLFFSTADDLYGYAVYSNGIYWVSVEEYVLYTLYQIVPCHGQFFTNQASLTTWENSVLQDSSFPYYPDVPNIGPWVYENYGIKPYISSALSALSSFQPVHFTYKFTSAVDTDVAYNYYTNLLAQQGYQKQIAFNNFYELYHNETTAVELYLYEEGIGIEMALYNGVNEEEMEFIYIASQSFYEEEMNRFFPTVLNPVQYLPMDISLYPLPTVILDENKTVQAVSYFLAFPGAAFPSDFVQYIAAMEERGFQWNIQYIENGNIQHVLENDTCTVTIVLTESFSIDFTIASIGY